MLRAMQLPAFLLVLTFVFTSIATDAAEPGWSPIVVPRGDYRTQIKSMPIEQRPYRPFHVYGNTVRRSYYRGNAVAMPRDIRTTAGELVRP